MNEAIAASTALAGCSLAPKYVRPETPVPPSWPVGDAYLRTSEAALPTVRYQDVFRDPRLQAIITQALTNNRDLRIAAANIAAARGQFHAEIDIPYSASTYKIVYRDSRDLDYKDGKIHKNYIRWVRLLDKGILRELRDNQNERTAQQLSDAAAKSFPAGQ